MQLEEYISLLQGLALIFSGLWIEQVLIYSYHNSYYFYGLHSILGLEGRKVSGTTYEIAEALQTDESDVTKAFVYPESGP